MRPVLTMRSCIFSDHRDGVTMVQERLPGNYKMSKQADVFQQSGLAQVQLTGGKQLDSYIAKNSIGQNIIMPLGKMCFLSL